jgi:hypothetical protein
MLEQLCARLGRESSAVRDRVTLVHGDIRCDDAGCRFPLIIALEGFETADFWELSGRHRSAAARESGSFERSCHKLAAQKPKSVAIRVSSGIRQRLRRTAGGPEEHNRIVRKQKTDGRRSQVSAGPSACSRPSGRGPRSHGLQTTPGLLLSCGWNRPCWTCRRPAQQRRQHDYVFKTSDVLGAPRALHHTYGFTGL